MGYFNLPRGQPPKEKVIESIPLSKGSRSIHHPSSQSKITQSDISSLTAKTASAGCQGKAKKWGQYNKWTSPMKGRFLIIAVGATTKWSISGAFCELDVFFSLFIINMHSANVILFYFISEPVSSDSGTDDDSQVLFISRSSLYDIKKRFKNSGGDIASTFTARSGLSTPDDIKVMTAIILCRDKNGNGMSRKDVISMLREICKAPSVKVAENLYDYLVQKGKQPDLK